MSHVRLLQTPSCTKLYSSQTHVPLMHVVPSVALHVAPLPQKDQRSERYIHRTTQHMSQAFMLPSNLSLLHRLYVKCYCHAFVTHFKACSTLTRIVDKQTAKAVLSLKYQAFFISKLRRRYDFKTFVPNICQNMLSLCLRYCIRILISYNVIQCLNFVSIHSVSTFVVVIFRSVVSDYTFSTKWQVRE